MGDGIRDKMLTYWKRYEPNLNSMMLDANAYQLHVEETSEIMSYLPNLAGKNLLELGSGIGRYTGLLAEQANHVLSVDFMESFVQKNREINGHFANVQFLQADVTQLDLPENKCEMFFDRFHAIFTNWLLMYLDDAEVMQLLGNMISWLRKDGHLFVRESCFQPSGKGVVRPRDNPTFYRDPAQYNNMLQFNFRKHNGHLGFQLVKANSVKTYIKLKSNPYQLCYLLRKMDSKGDRENDTTLQQFLDGKQYTRSGILRYEQIYGRNFVSTGGLQTTKEFCKSLDLKPGELVLDVGCGIGGSAFYMAKTYGVKVHGVDLSANMISIAFERQQEELDKNMVSFEISDITEQNYPSESYDVIYSRDTLLHVADKTRLFQKFLEWLKPGGRLLISDYCHGDQRHSEEFTRYVTERSYHLFTVQEYGQLLRSLGFVDVNAEDRTSQFVDILETEMAYFKQNSKAFLQNFSAEDSDYILDGWSSKIRRCKAGDQAWGLFSARK